AWIVGPHKAKEMSFVVGSTMTGREAFDYGFANHVYTADRLAEETFAVAEKIAKLSPELLELKKLAINRVMDAQGFRETVLYGAEWDAIAHTSAGVTKTRGWLRDEGIKGAITNY